MYKSSSKYVQRSIEKSHKERNRKKIKISGKVESSRINKLSRQIKLHTIHQGRVTEIYDHGAIVMIKGLKTYLDISKIDNSYVKHPSQFLKINQCVSVMVLSKGYDSKGRFSIHVSMTEVDKSLRRPSVKRRSGETGQIIDLY